MNERTDKEIKLAISQLSAVKNQLRTERKSGLTTVFKGTLTLGSFKSSKEGIKATRYRDTVELLTFDDEESTINWITE